MCNSRGAQRLNWCFLLVMSVRAWMMFLLREWEINRKIQDLAGIPTQDLKSQYESLTLLPLSYALYLNTRSRIQTWVTFQQNNSHVFFFYWKRKFTWCVNIKKLHTLTLVVTIRETARKLSSEIHQILPTTELEWIQNGYFSSIIAQLGTVDMGGKNCTKDTQRVSASVFEIIKTSTCRDGSLKTTK